MIFEISEPIYESTLFCFVGEGLENVSKVILENDPEHGECVVGNLPESADAAVLAPIGNTVGYLWVEHNPKRSADDISLVAHELTHFAVHIMNHVECDISREDEPFCYYLEFLTREFWKKHAEGKK